MQNEAGRAAFQIARVRFEGLLPPKQMTVRKALNYSGAEHSPWISNPGVGDAIDYPVLIGGFADPHDDVDDDHSHESHGNGDHGGEEDHDGDGHRRRSLQSEERSQTRPHF